MNYVVLRLQAAAPGSGNIPGAVLRLAWQAMKRVTTQRKAIMQALESAPGPLTPQELLARASEQGESLGLATVYRNLSLLERNGDIMPVRLPGESTRYEPVRHGHHHHFQCRQCEVVFEFAAPCPVAALQGATLPGGFQVTDHALTFYGSCPACSELGPADGTGPAPG
jgi:Fur family ferric uptake transcriptional regulator